METAAMDFSYFASAQPPFQSFMYADDNLSDPLDPQFSNLNYDAFSPFSQSLLAGAGAGSGSPPATSHSPLATAIGSVDSGLGGDGMEGLMRESKAGSGSGSNHTTRGSSEEKEVGLTPAQSRRKAQNRAAQRAFRERKEKHVKELEARLNAAESSANSLQTDNERLRLALQRIKTENEILRATSSHLPSSSSKNADNDDDEDEEDEPDSPISPHTTRRRRSSGSNSPDDVLLPDAPARSTSLSHKRRRSLRNSLGGGGGIKRNSTGSSSVLNSAYSTAPVLQTKQPLTAGGAWDLIQSHPLVRAGLVDIGDVCQRLKGLARCDGLGPVFEEKEV